MNEEAIHRAALVICEAADHERSGHMPPPACGFHVEVARAAISAYLEAE